MGSRNEVERLPAPYGNQYEAPPAPDVEEKKNKFGRMGTGMAAGAVAGVVGGIASNWKKIQQWIKERKEKKRRR